MTASKDILKIIPVVHSAALVKRNVDYIKKKKKKDNILKLGTDNFLGTAFISAEGDFINAIE